MYAIDIGINDLFTSKFGQIASNALTGIQNLGDKLKSAFSLNTTPIRAAVEQLIPSIQTTKYNIEQLEAKISLLTQKRNSVTDLGILKGVNKEIEDTQKKIAELKNLGNGAGGKINQLQDKISQLTNSRNAATDFGIVKGLNKEINQAQKELQRLENMGTNTNPFTKLKNDALMAVPALGLVANPIVAGSLALSGATSMAMNFEQGMAKINSTLQVSPPELEKIKNQLITLGKTSNVDLAQVPNAFEKIVSAVGDAGKSMAIFKSSLKASKAGFTDINIVADAGAAILANYNGMSSDYAMDVLMKVKNLGKAEFGDLAKYLPQLLPDAKRLGISFEEMGGAFAYFTSKGISVEQTSTYLKNMMKPLGDPDKIANLERFGVSVFEIGENGEKKMRPLLSIGTDLNKAMDKLGMDAPAKLQAFKKLEYDMEAGAGFSLLMQDIPKLTSMMIGTKEATGETERTLKFTGNTIDNLTELSNKFKAVFIQLGDFVIPLVNQGATLLGQTFDVFTPVFGRLGEVILPIFNFGMGALSSIFEMIRPVFNWFYEKANIFIPVIATLGGMFALWNASIIYSNILIIGLNAVVSIGAGIMAVFNAVMSMNPLVAFALAIVGVIAGLALLYDNFEPFRGLVDTVFWAMNTAIKAVIDTVLSLITTISTAIRTGGEFFGFWNKEERLQKEKEGADQKNAKMQIDEKQRDLEDKQFSQGKGLFLTDKLKPAAVSSILPFGEKQETALEKVQKSMEQKKKENSVQGQGTKIDAYKGMKEYMTPEEKKAQKAGTGKLSLGTFGVEGDTRQAKNITANIGTLGGIQKIEIHVGSAQDVTPELKQKLNDTVREALIGSVRDFETMY